MLTSLKHLIFGRPMGDLVRRTLHERTRDFFHRFLVGPTQNLDRERRRLALQRSAELVEQEMARARAFHYPLDLLRWSFDQVQVAEPRMNLEFGVFEGVTINWLARATDKILYGFDSFEGLPERWREGFEAGRFKVRGLPRVRPNVRLVKGWFDQSIAPFAMEHPEPIGFLHVDSDLYSSAKTIFDLLGSRLRPGSVIVFDEFFNYPGWEEGEYRAFMELVRVRNLRFEYLAYCDYGQQVTVRLVE